MSDFCDYNTSTKLLGKQLVTVALLVLHFSLHETILPLVSLFYGKCYVTMFIRESLRSPIAIGENFFLKKMRRNCLESFFFIENVGFCFSFPSFLNRFFLSVSFRYILYFFLVVNDLTDFVGFAIYFFFIVMKRHNRFFLNW